MNTSSPIRVAIIDDDESLGRSLSRFLEASDIQSAIYLSGEEFLADPHRRRFDCLLLDIRFQGISGIELQCQLAAESSRIPIIFITADDDPEVRKQAFAVGCAAFFQKTEEGSCVVNAIFRATTLSPSSTIDH